MSVENLFVYVGTVGSGKSTQINNLARGLELEGFKVKKTFLKTGHLFAYLFEVFLAKILVREKLEFSPIRALLQKKAKTFKRLFRIWVLLDLMSITLRFLFKVYIPLKLGYTVLCEEYIPAILADYKYISKNLKLKPSTVSFPLRYISKLGHLAPPTKVIYLDADMNTLLSRWDERGSGKVLPRYIKMQRSLLLSISNNFSPGELLYINTKNCGIEETLEKVTKNLNLKKRELGDKKTKGNTCLLSSSNQD